MGEAAERIDSVVPEKLDPFPEDHALKLRSIYTVSERMGKVSKAAEEFSDTSDGFDAAQVINDLIDELHRTPYDDVERVFTQIKRIFKAWNINLEI